MKPFLPGAKSEMPGWPGWQDGQDGRMAGGRMARMAARGQSEGDLPVYRSILHEEDHSAILHVSVF